MRKVTILGLVLGSLALGLGSYVLKTPKVLYTQETKVLNTKNNKETVVKKDTSRHPLLQQRKKKQATYAKRRKSSSLHPRRPKAVQRQGPVEHNQRARKPELSEGN